MTNLLCRIGLHHATWTPQLRQTHEFTPAIRKCRRCGQPLPRPHR